MLSMWTIYDHPTDFPNVFVARRHEVGKDGSRATPDFIVSSDLEMLRLIMSRRGLFPIARSPEDDPKIVETWI